MKVTIYYEYLPQYEHKYWAKTDLPGFGYMGCCGHSWDAARADLMKKLAKLSEPLPVPPAEEQIDVEVAHVC